MDVPAIHAQLNNKKIPTLKTLAARNLISDSDQLCMLRSKISTVTPQCKEHLFKTILKEKASELEQIVHTQPLRLLFQESVRSLIVRSVGSTYMLMLKYPSSEGGRDLIKVTTQTLHHEKIFELPFNAVIKVSPSEQHVALVTLLNNSTLQLSRYTMQSNQWEKYNLTMLPQNYVPILSIEFSLDDRYIIISHENKTFVINAENGQLRYELVDSHKAKMLDENRLLTHDATNHQIKVVEFSQGNVLFSCQSPGKIRSFDFNLKLQHLYTACKKTLYVWDSNDGTLLKQIVFQRAILKITQAYSKLIIALKKVNNEGCDTLEINPMTGCYKTPITEIPTVSSDGLFNLQMAVGTTDVTLYDSNERPIQRHFPGPDATFIKTLLSPDNSFIFAIAINSSAGKTGYKFLTHRAITNNATLQELLALLILYQQKKDQQECDQQLCTELLQSQNPEIRRITREHYLELI